MIPCSTCGHHNLPSYTTCSKCGGALAGGGRPPSGAFGAAAGNDYEKLLADRKAAAKRSRVIYGGVALLVLGVGGGKMMQDRAKKAELQVKIDFFDRWVTAEKKETGSFWNCVMASEVDVGMFSNATQIQQRIESAYFTQQKTFSDLLTNDCVPKIERARQAMASMAGEAPVEFKAPLQEYAATLPKLQSGIESYAEKIKNRGATKDIDALIQENGNAWHAEKQPNPQTIGFDKFLGCAVPGIDKLKDAQALLERLAEECYKKDPVVFMDRARKECGAFLSNTDTKAKPSPEYKARQKKLYEEDARQLQAWDSCSRKSRKGKKVEDLEDFLGAVGDYMKNRTGVAQVAKDLAGLGGEAEGAEKKPEGAAAPKKAAH